MDKIVIAGGQRLRGEIQVSGAKNAALPLLASSLLSTGASTWHNVPNLNDVSTMGKLLRRLGCEVSSASDATADGQDTLIIHPYRVEKAGFTAPYELVKTMRASVLVLGPLAARYGRARVSLPGGCAIGARPIDMHLRALEAMGAQISLDHGYVDLSVPHGRLRGSNIVFDVPTVTGTENILMAAALARGRSVIENAAREPEVEELAIVLNKMGARIQGAGTAVIQVEGVEELHPIEHAILPDRIEAGTFLVAAAIAGDDVLVKDCRPEHLDAVMAKLRTSGVRMEIEEGGIRVFGNRDLDIQAVDVTTQPHPGFPTDMQAQFMVLACCAHGQSVIKETIFENRFMHVPELSRMGADIHIDGRVAIIRGRRPLAGATVMATDLRASASLVLAGLVAKGRTEVLRVYHLDRGYERIERKLRAIGAHIERVEA